MARVPDEAIRRRKELSNGAWNLYVEYCRHRNHDTGRCDPGLERLAELLDRTYNHVSDMKSELAGKGWIERLGKNAVDLLVGDFPQPKVRWSPSRRDRRPGRKSGHKYGKFPNSRPDFPDTSTEIFRTLGAPSSDGIRTQVRKESELSAAHPYSEPVLEPVAAAASPAGGSAPPEPDPGDLVCDEAYVAKVKALRKYPPDFVDFIWRKLRDRCEAQTRRYGYPVPPSRRQFDWWLENELTPAQQRLPTVSSGVEDVRLRQSLKANCDASCPKCFGTGTEVVPGKGARRCVGAGGQEDSPESAGVVEGLKVVNGGS